MAKIIEELEAERLDIQSRLDAAKTPAERNRLGQFATPTSLARDILAYATTLLPKNEPIYFLDPAIGTGSFFSALLANFPTERIREAKGFEIDPHYSEPAAQLWKESPLSITLSDFTKQKPEPRFNLLVCNPPYVRHHHLSAEEKARLQFRAIQSCGIKIPKLAGLYCYFLGISHAWLSKGAISAWLIPSEFMDVNYGQPVKRYLMDRVTLLHIHRFDPNDVQFSDALVSSAIVWLKNESPPNDHAVTFSFGGSMLKPRLSKTIPAKALAAEPKWTRFPASEIRVRSKDPTVSDFFNIKRGLATGDNEFFILTAEEVAARQLPFECFRPILPSPRYLKIDEVMADSCGIPLIDHCHFLLDIRLPEEEIRERYPTLWAYIEEGKAKGLHERYLCRHRKPWYGQENRAPAPIVCTYLGRGDAKYGRPFRFILNRSRATVSNVYLAMYPQPELAAALKRSPDLILRVWKTLNSITPERMLGEGRVYGGGLHKLEPKELGNVPIPELADLISDRRSISRQPSFLEAGVY